MPEPEPTPKRYQATRTMTRRRRREDRRIHRKEQSCPSRSLPLRHQATQTTRTLRSIAKLTEDMGIMPEPEPTPAPSSDADDDEEASSEKTAAFSLEDMGIMPEPEPPPAPSWQTTRTPERRPLPSRLRTWASCLEPDAPSRGGFEQVDEEEVAKKTAALSLEDLGIEPNQRRQDRGRSRHRGGR